MSLTTTVLAQIGDEEIGGTGTPNFIAKFLGANKIGNSNIFQSPDGNIGIGTNFLTGKLSVLQTSDSLLNGFQPNAVYGNVTSGMNFAGGVRGDATANSGNASGVIGVSYSPGGNGVLGLRTASEGTGGAGVVGTTQSTGGFSYGVRGTAEGMSGFAFGVFGETFSPDGVAAFFANHAAGNIVEGA